MKSIKLIFTTMILGIFVAVSANAQSTETKSDEKTETKVEKKECKKGKKACCKKEGAKCEHAKGEKCDHAKAEGAKACPHGHGKASTDAKSEDKAEQADDEELAPKGVKTRKIAITEEGIPASTKTSSKTAKPGTPK